MNEKQHLLDALAAIPPAELNYQDWCAVGMALKQEGFEVEVWDRWSQADHRYHPGECRKKWAGFHGSGTPVTGGTIVALAQQFGFITGGLGAEIGWDEEIDAERDEMRVAEKMHKEDLL